MRVLSSDAPFSYSQSGSANHNLPACSAQCAVCAGRSLYQFIVFNDLFVDHCIETCYETCEEQHLAVLLNGMCVSRPGVSSCESLGRRLASTMHLSYGIRTLLLSAYKNKKLTLTTFRLCCASIGLKTDAGSNHGHDLSHKLQQRLTCWGLWFPARARLSPQYQLRCNQFRLHVPGSAACQPYTL